MKKYINEQEITCDIELIDSELSNLRQKIRIIDDCCYEKNVKQGFKEFSIATLLGGELENALKQIKCKEAIPEDKKKVDIEERAVLTRNYLQNYRDNEFVAPVPVSAKVSKDIDNQK